MSVEVVTVNYFCIRRKNRRRHNQQSKLHFQNKFTLQHIRLNIYIWKTKFTSYKQYFFVFLFSRKKKTDTDQSILQAFYSASKEASHKPLKVAAANKSFPSMFIIDITCFDECISLHVITGNSIFCTSLLLPRGLVQPPNC